jgi:hypothetical protein
MQPLATRLAVALAAAATLAAAASTVAAPLRPGGLYEIFESLMVLRDGHGARHVQHPTAEPRRSAP